MLKNVKNYSSKKCKNCQKFIHQKNVKIVKKIIHQKNVKKLFLKKM